MMTHHLEAKEQIAMAACIGIVLIGVYLADSDPIAEEEKRNERIRRTCIAQVQPKMEPEYTQCLRRIKRELENGGGDE